MVTGGLTDSAVKGSSEAYERACQVLPGGVTANIKYFAPHPIVMKRACGSKLFDVDGHAYIDYMLCYGALITGHGHPRVLQAITDQMKAIGTTVFGTPHELEAELAEKLTNLYPGVDMVRFTNSGLEATLLAIRIAKAFTGKEKIAKFEGHYHGGYNQVLFSVHPDLNRAGESDHPIPVPELSGMSAYDRKQTVILPFNNLGATERLLRRHADELAAVILEPVQGGFIPAELDFIHGLRKVTEELNIVLIFDEVKTGFRVSLGGAQKVYGVKPDLTALGKVLGGGFPIGAVGGKKEMMQMTDPRRGRDILSAVHSESDETDVLFHSGTYNGHPIVLAAGLATVRILEEKGTLDELSAKTEKLRRMLEEVYLRYGVPMQTLGWGSIFNIVLTNRPVKNYRDMHQDNQALRKALDYELLRLGIYVKPLNRYSMSTAHVEADIERTVEAHESALKKIVPRHPAR